MHHTLEQTAEYMAVKERLATQAFEQDIREKLILLQVLWFEITRQTKGENKRPVHYDFLQKDVSERLDECLNLAIRTLAQGSAWKKPFQYLHFLEQEIHGKNHT